LDINNKNVDILNNTEKSDIIEENVTHVQIISDPAEDNTTNDKETNDVEKQFISYASASSDESQSDYETASDNEDDKTSNLVDKFSKLKCNPIDLEVEDEAEGKYVVDDILASIDIKSKSDESFEDEDDDKDDEDSDWITPGKFNFINQLLIQINAQVHTIEIYRVNLINSFFKNKFRDK